MKLIDFIFVIKKTMFLEPIIKVIIIGQQYNKFNTRWKLKNYFSKEMTSKCKFKTCKVKLDGMQNIIPCTLPSPIIKKGDTRKKQNNYRRYFENLSVFF